MRIFVRSGPFVTGVMRAGTSSALKATPSTINAAAPHLTIGIVSYVGKFVSITVCVCFSRN